MNNNAELYANVKSLIATSGSKFVSVTFIKKDGSERQMTFNPRYIGYIKGDAALPYAQKAAQTRKENHPELFNVFDSNKREPRSFNMDKLVKVRVNGVDYLRSGDKLLAAVQNL